MVTATVVLLARWQAASLYLPEIDALRLDLSMRDGSPELTERAGGAAEPYREVLRGVRDRLAATLRAIEDRLDRHAVLEPFDLRRPRRSWPSRWRCAADRSSRPATACSPAAACWTCSAASPPSAPRWCASTFGRTPRATPGAVGDHASTWVLATTRRGTRPRRQAVPARRAGQQAASRAARAVGVAGGATRSSRPSAWPRSLPPESLGAYVISMTRAALRRPRGRAAAEGSAHRARRSASSRSSKR